MNGRSFEVRLGDTLVGWLAEQDDGRIGFRFGESYRSDPYRPVMSQSLEDDLVRTYWGRHPGDLPAFFANMLPEGRFREVLERSLALEDANDLDLLTALSEDLPGAVELRAGSHPVFPATQHAGDDDHAGERNQLEFRFSLAGVQLKFSLAQRGDRFAIPAHGRHGDWIVKVSANEYPGLPENEYTIMEWARATGFDVPECQLHPHTAVPYLARLVHIDTLVLAVKRYDREAGRRIHQEDFMQVFGWQPARTRKYDSTYEQLVSVVQGLLGDAGFDEMVKRLALVVASGNNDAHLKNWSLYYPEGQPKLTPLYDQVATVAWPKLDRTLALKLAGARDFGRISAEAFRRLAQKVGRDPKRTAELARETAAALQMTWLKLEARGRFPDGHAAALREHWARVPFLRDIGALPSD